MKNNNWLITVDLDGTLLMSPTESEILNYSVNPKNIEIIKKLMQMGHKVAIVTGRPWRETKSVYEKMGLETIVVNYNGAHIHHPVNKSFIDLIFSMNKEILFEIFNEDIIKENANGFIIETIEKSYINGKISKDIQEMMGIRNEETLKENWNIGENINSNPQAAFISLNSKSENPFEILDHVKRKYGDSMSLRLWDGRKDENPYIILEINQMAVNKGNAMEYIAAYYNIPKRNTISFGDGLNDKEMLIQASRGIAMKNAKGTVKSYADDTTDFNNNEAGVGKYLESFFEIK